MEKLVETWKDHVFNRDSNDVKEFASQLKDAVSRSLPNGWELYRCEPDEFGVFGFVHNTEKDKWIYFSISDVVAFPKDWINCIIIRHAKDQNDFESKKNHFTSALDFKKNIEWLGNK